MSQLPREARIHKAIDRSAEWGWAEYYLAELVDAMNIWLWFNSSDAKHASKRPKTVKPDFIAAAQRKSRKPAEQAPMEIKEVKNLLKRRRYV